jgi:hypothetical protein
MYNEPTSKNPNFVRLELTTEQKAQVRNSIGRDADAIELSAKELEERIAPMIRLQALDE